MADLAAGTVYSQAVETTEYLKSRLPKDLAAPALAIVCGSGLGGLELSIRERPRFEAAYAEIPNFAISTVHGHAGRLVFGHLGESSVPVVLMVGRAHYYEGNSISAITFPIRVFKLLGVKTVIVTNAAGALNTDYSVGDVVVLNDHINLAGLAGIHPLRGPGTDGFGPRFTALSDAYDLGLRRLAHSAWRALSTSKGSRRMHEGVYAFVGGPTYETRAESRMLRILGADLVGMSTVPEIIVARHCGLDVFALSLVTNNVVLEPGPRGDDRLVEGASGNDLSEVMAAGKASHDEVLRAGQEAAQTVQTLIVEMVRRLQDS